MSFAAIDKLCDVSLSLATSLAMPSRAPARARSRGALPAVWRKVAIAITLGAFMVSNGPVPSVHAQDIGAVTGERAIVTAEAERNFGRLTLAFPDRLDLPAYEVDTENGVLRIVFDEAVDTDIRDAGRTLADYVTVARADPDGRALRFALARAVRINTMEAGETLFVDFLPQNWQGFPPPLPEDVIARLAERAEQAAREAAEAERRRLLGELEPEVTLRVGAAPTFTRYGFAWNVPFNVEVTQAGAELSATFDFDVPIDLTPALIDQADELVEISAEQDGASLTVTMEVEPGSGLRWFQDEQSFIVDLDRRAVRDTVDVDQAEIDRVLADLVPAGNDAPNGATRFSSVGARDGDVALPAAETPVAERERPLNEVLAERVVDDGGPAPLTAGPGSVTEAAAPSRTAEPTIATPSDRSPEPLAVADDANGRVAPRAPEVSPPRDEAALDPSLVRIDVRREGDTAQLSFPFIEPTPAAAFRRSNMVTLVFETSVSFDLRTLRLELSDLVQRLETSQRSGLNVLHLDLREGGLVSLVPSGERWLALIGPSVVEPVEPFDIGRGTFPDGRAYADLEAEGLGSVHTITDPYIGDTLMVVPMVPPVRGSLAGQNFAEFAVLPSAQGLVVRPKVDGLSVRREGNRAVILSDAGLSLSDVGIPLGSFGFAPTERPGYFDMSAYMEDGPRSFENRYGAFQDELALAEGVVRRERLMEFARFLLAFDLGQEANGALEMALSEAASLEHDEGFLTLRTAALVMAGRYEEAAALSRVHALNDRIDARLWGLLADAGLRDWPQVNQAYDEVAAILDGYPHRISSRVRLSGVEAALELKAIDLAFDRLSQVEPGLVDGRLTNRLALLQARADLARGRVDAALEEFDRLRDRSEGPISAQATLLAVGARLDEGRVTLEEALEGLENLAVAWRGDDTEVRTRAILGDLYLEQGRYREALTALKGVLVAQPDHPLADDVSDNMQAVFSDLFLNGEADGMTAIDALSLFYDFRELTPIGRRGDELVRRLADRLVEIDLLDQAADLLEHQVDNRLSGTAKAQIAADLALIYLMDRRPAEAVATLQRSRISQIPRTIERGRRIIEARALSELGRHELALEMLRDLEGTDVDTVRSDILWNAERWMDTGVVIERALGDRWRDTVPLSDPEMQDILRAAIAFSFAKDDHALERLRARYEPKMTDGVYASAFDVVTAPIDSQGSAFRDVVRGIAGVSTLNRFLDDYRSTFSSRALVQTAPGA